MAKESFIVEEQDPPEMPVKNWVLAMIFDKGERRSRDALSIMYEVFILTKEVLPSIEPKFEFERNCFGPYSEKVAKSMRQFLSTNLLEMKENDSTATGGFDFLLTESGAQKAGKIIQKFSESLRGNMEFMKLVTAHMGLTGMLQYIQSIYPEYVYLHERGENIV